MLIKCLDKLQAAPGEGYKPLARAIVTNRFREIVREEHLRGQWVQCELSDAVLSHDCKDVTSFNDEFFTRELERYRGYYQKSRERILKKVRERWAENYEHEREYARQYYQDRRDKIIARCRKYYEAHKEEIKARQREKYYERKQKRC